VISVRYSLRRPDGSVKQSLLRVPEKTGDEGFALLERFVARFPPDEATRGSDPPDAAVVEGPRAPVRRRSRDDYGPTLPHPGGAREGARVLGDREGGGGSRDGVQLGVGAAGVRDTSQVAHAKLEASGRLTRQQRELVEFLQANRQRDYTRQELAQALGWGINVVTGRVNELLRQPFEVIEEFSRRPCRITGQGAHPVRLKRQS